MTDTVSIIALCLALIVAGVIILLFKKKIIDEKAIEGVGQVLDGIPVTEGPFVMIRDYAKIAVRAVEQLVKSGHIDRDDVKRKDAAMDMVEAAAKADGLTYGDAEKNVADMCIEAEVLELPRNQQKPPDGE